VADHLLERVRREVRVEPGTPAELADRATGATLGFEKARAPRDLAGLTERLHVLQNRLWAEDRRALLLVLQGLDASGKDGTIRRVFTGLNPQGCRVVSFKAPTTTELDHDYLWRVHAVLPERGSIGIFNRSHYEDVVTAQVLGVIDNERRRRRYAHIREFERMLVDEGTAIVKVFLHIGKNEQRERLQARLDDPEKRWKFGRDDLDTRRRWDEYHALYEEALSTTSTEWAPWHVVPADRKWVSANAVAALLVDQLEAMAPTVPAPADGLENVVIE